MLFVRKENKNNFSSTIRLLSVSPRKHSAILDITHRTHAAYALLYPMQRCVFYVYLRFDLNKNSASFCWGGYRRAYAVCVRWVISKMALRLRGETEEMNCWRKVIFSLRTKSILIADGLPWRCFSFFSEPRQWYLFTWQSMGQSQASRFLSKIF